MLYRGNKYKGIVYNYNNILLGAYKELLGLVEIHMLGQIRSCYGC